MIPLPSGLNVARGISIAKSISLEKISNASHLRYWRANKKVKNDKIKYLPLYSLFKSMDSARLPKQNEVYLKVNCVGYASRHYTVLHDQDPMYIYKIFISLCLGNGLLVDRAVHNEQGLAIGVYESENKFVTSLRRPNEDGVFTNTYKFKLDIQVTEIKKVCKMLSELMQKQKIKDNEILRNQILNSLYWYYEINKTQSNNLKLVFFTSVFDSFFNADDKANVKSQVIAKSISDTIKDETEIKRALAAMYKQRNSIIHGEIPLFDYHYDSDGVNRGTEYYVKVLLTRYYFEYLRLQRYKYHNSIEVK